MGYPGPPPLQYCTILQYTMFTCTHLRSRSMILTIVASFLSFWLSQLLYTITLNNSLLFLVKPKWLDIPKYLCWDCLLYTCQKKLKNIMFYWIIWMKKYKLKLDLCAIFLFCLFNFCLVFSPFFIIISQDQHFMKFRQKFAGCWNWIFGWA